MPYHQRTLLALLAPATCLAISLSDFVPRIDDPSSLTPPCAAVYNAPIAGCTASDFSGVGGNCSPTCIGGMINIGTNVYAACAGSTQNNVGVIGAFLNGYGPASLCPDISRGARASSSSGGASATAEATSTPAATNPPSSTRPDVTSLTSETSMLSSLASPPSSLIGITTATDAPPISSEATPTSGIKSVPSVTNMSSVTANPPPALTSSHNTPTPTPTEDCIPNGGGGSIVGEQSCSSDAPAFLTGPGNWSLTLAWWVTSIAALWAAGLLL